MSGKTKKQLKEELKELKARFRALGSHPGITIPRVGRKYCVQTESGPLPVKVKRWGGFVNIPEEMNDMVERVKDELVKELAEAMIESNMVQFIVKKADPFDPMCESVTVAVKMYAIPWEEMVTGAALVEGWPPI